MQCPGVAKELAWKAERCSAKALLATGCIFYIKLPYYEASECGWPQYLMLSLQVGVGNIREHMAKHSAATEDFNRRKLSLASQVPPTSTLSGPWHFL